MASVRFAPSSSSLEARNDGTVRLNNVQLVKSKDHSVVMNRQGELVLVDEIGRERERYGLQYGARLMVEDGQRVKGGQLLAEWDPFAMPIVTEVSGYVKYGDIVDGVTMQESLDEVTGLSRKTIIESQGRGEPPAHHAEGRGRQHRQAPRRASADRREARYFLPVGSNIFVNDGDYIEAGDVIAKISRETTKTKDITGGLPRVAELFEARKPKDHAVICEIDGVVHFGKDTKGKRKVLIVPEVGDPAEYLIPKGKHLSRPRRRPRARGRGADGRSGEPARHPQGARRARAGEVPGRRDPGGLPTPGRAHQRQAHRGDRSPDAASRDA